MASDTIPRMHSSEQRHAVHALRWDRITSHEAFYSSEDWFERTALGGDLPAKAERLRKIAGRLSLLVAGGAFVSVVARVLFEATVEQVVMDRIGVWLGGTVLVVAATLAGPLIAWFKEAEWRDALRDIAGEVSTVAAALTEGVPNLIPSRQMLLGQGSIRFSLGDKGLLISAGEARFEMPWCHLAHGTLVRREGVSVRTEADGPNRREGDIDHATHLIIHVRRVSRPSDARTAGGSIGEFLVVPRRLFFPDHDQASWGTFIAALRRNGVPIERG